MEDGPGPHIIRGGKFVGVVVGVLVTVPEPDADADALTDTDCDALPVAVGLVELLADADGVMVPVALDDTEAVADPELEGLPLIDGLALALSDGLLDLVADPDSEADDDGADDIVTATDADDVEVGSADADAELLAADDLLADALADAVDEGSADLDAVDEALTVAVLLGDAALDTDGALEAEALPDDEAAAVADAREASADAEPEDEGEAVDEPLPDGLPVLLLEAVADGEADPVREGPVAWSHQTSGWLESVQIPPVHVITPCRRRASALLPSSDRCDRVATSTASPSANRRCRSTDAGGRSRGSSFDSC